MKKILSLLLAMLALVLVFVGCSPAEDEPEETGISVHVTIAKDGSEILAADVVVPGDKPSVADAVIKACQQKKMAYTYEDGMFDGFNGIASTQTDGWLLYIDGELAQSGAKDIELAEDMLIIFSYDNYDTAFTLE